MEKEIGKLLTEEFAGKKVKLNTPWRYLSNEEVLTESEEFEGSELSVCFGLEIDVDAEQAIRYIDATFATYFPGGYGVGDADPADYFTVSQCVSAARKYISKLLA